MARPEILRAQLEEFVPGFRVGERMGLPWEAAAGDCCSAKMTGQKIQDAHALSTLQEGMLFEELEAPGDQIYTGPFGCTLRGPLHQGAVRRWRSPLSWWTS